MKSFNLFKKKDILKPSISKETIEHSAKDKGEKGAGEIHSEIATETPVSSILENAVKDADKNVIDTATGNLQPDVLYKPGNEPEKIRKRIEKLCAKLDGAYPDKVVSRLYNEHKHWAETVLDLRKELGYESNTAFLEAYGYTVTVPATKPGPAASDYSDVITELKKRYPDGPKFSKVDDLKSDNPDLAPKFKSMENKANELFGMTLAKYFKKIGLLIDSSATARLNFEQEIKKLKERYPEPASITVSELKNQNPDIEWLSLTKWALLLFGKEGKTFPEILIEHNIVKAVDPNQKYINELNRIVDTLKSRYEGKDLPANINRLVNENSDIITAMRLRYLCDKVTGKTPGAYLSEMGIIAKEREGFDLTSYSRIEDKLKAVTDELKRRYEDKEELPLYIPQLVKENPDIPLDNLKNWTKKATGKSQVKYLQDENILVDLKKEYEKETKRRKALPKTKKPEIDYSDVLEGNNRNGARSISVRVSMVTEGFNYAYENGYALARHERMRVGDEVKLVHKNENIYTVTDVNEKELGYVFINLDLSKYILKNAVVTQSKPSSKLSDSPTAPHMIITIEYCPIRKNNIYIESLIKQARKMAESNENKKEDHVIEDGIYKEYLGNDEILVIPNGVKRIAKKAVANKEKLKVVIIPDSVEAVEPFAFAQNCTNISHFDIPKGLKEIDEGAFGSHYYDSYRYSNMHWSNTWLDSFDHYFTVINGCLYSANPVDDNLIIPEGVEKILPRAVLSGKLKNITLPSTLKRIEEDAFCDVDIAAITLPEGLKYIGRAAFRYCESLKRIVIPESVTEIGEEAFAVCRKLKEVVLPSTLKSIPAGIFKKCSGLKDLTIPEGVTEIGKGAFVETSLTSIKFPSTLKTLHGSIFAGANNDDRTNITQIELNEGLERIGDYAFKNTLISSIVIPASVKEIGNSIFYNCTRLKSIALPENIKNIPYGMFRECSSLEEFTVPEGVTVIDSYAFYWCRYLKNVTLPSTLRSINSDAFSMCTSLEKIVIPEGVTEIGSWAFKDAGKLEKVVLPSTLKKIGRSAFENCPSLKEIVIPASVESIEDHAFCDCSHLKKANIQNKNTKLGSGVFKGTMVDLRTKDGNAFHIDEGRLVSYTGYDTNVVIPNSVTSIESAAFQSAIDLVSLVIPDSVTELGDNIFGYSSYVEPKLKKVSIGNGVEIITNDLFSGYEKLQEVTLGKNIRDIGESAFEDCTALKSIDFPKTLKTIEEYAFCNCESLKCVIIPEGVTKIGSRAFFGCKNLEKVILPNTLMELEWKAFAECPSLIEVKLPEHLMNVVDDVFDDFDKIVQKAELAKKLVVDNIAFSDDKKTLIKLLNNKSRTLVIPDTVKIIGERAFENAPAEEIILPDGLIEIGTKAFYGCKNLKRIIIPVSVTKIGSMMFLGCNSLKSVTLPDSVTEIPEKAFYGCDNFTEIKLGKSVEIIGEKAFWGCEKLSRLNIPEKSKINGEKVFDYCPKLNFEEEK